MQDYHDDFPRAIRDVQNAMRRDLTPEEVESFAYHPESHYEPTAADLAEMADWSQNVQDHDDALDFWLGFFDCEEERSTFYID